MQSEGGAAGAVHGALQTGALTTTFTASQGLLLMIPNMYKIAGELTPAVFHVAARAVATHALSIFGDHSDVMSVRATGFAMLASALGAGGARLGRDRPGGDARGARPVRALLRRLPHLARGREDRALDDDDLRALVDESTRARAPRSAALIARATRRARHRAEPRRVLPVARGGEPLLRAPARHRAQRDGRASPTLTGRRYRLFDYFGDPDAERVIVLMGSGAETARETVDALRARGEQVGVLAGAPLPAVRRGAAARGAARVDAAIAVLDRTKEPGAPASRSTWTWSRRSPRRCDAAARRSVRASSAAATGSARRSSRRRWSRPSSTSSRRRAEEPLHRRHRRRRHADTSLDVDPSFDTESDRVVRAVFFGLGSDGTVGANKNTHQDHRRGRPDVFAQGYFVYDSKKSGSQTVSHLRFGPEPIRSAYLDRERELRRLPPVRLPRAHRRARAARRHGATLLLDAPYAPRRGLGRAARARFSSRSSKAASALWVIDAGEVAREAGLGARTNTIMQTCFFAISGVLPREEAIAKITQAIEKTYGKKGDEVVRQELRGRRPDARAAFTSVEIAASVSRRTRRRLPARPRRRRPPSCARSPRG